MADRRRLGIGVLLWPLGWRPRLGHQAVLLLLAWRAAGGLAAGRACSRAHSSRASRGATGPWALAAAGAARAGPRRAGRPSPLEARELWRSVWGWVVLVWVSKLFQVASNAIMRASSCSRSFAVAVLHRKMVVPAYIQWLHFGRRGPRLVVMDNSRQAGMAIGVINRGLTGKGSRRIRVGQLAATCSCALRRQGGNGFRANSRGRTDKEFRAGSEWGSWPRPAYGTCKQNGFVFRRVQMHARHIDTAVGTLVAIGCPPHRFQETKFFTRPLSKIKCKKAPPSPSEASQRPPLGPQRVTMKSLESLFRNTVWRPSRTRGRAAPLQRSTVRTTRPEPTQHARRVPPGCV